MFKNSFVSLIFCAGGVGSRMGSSIPKQYLLLGGKPIALYSFELFEDSPEIDEIVVVCDSSYQHLFQSAKKTLVFAQPGKQRQNSVYSGLLKTSEKANLVLTHDSARPFLERKDLLAFLETLHRMGASALASPVVCTIKQCDPNRRVEKTLDRSKLWEMQTPQGLKRSLFFQAYGYADQKKLAVTDDMSLAEAFGHPVELVPGSPRNFKITTPFDLAVAKTLLEESCAISS